MEYRGYKFRIYPDKEQEILLSKHFGATRFTYNKFLRIKSWLYKSWKSGKHQSTPKTSKFQLAGLLVKYKTKKRYSWLKEVNSQSLVASVHQLDRAFQNFFKKGYGYPNFKKKRSKQSFQIPQHFRIENGRLHIPKFWKGIKIQQHRFFPKDSKFKSVVISKMPTGKYYASILIEIPLVVRVSNFIHKSCGIDLGLISLFATSYGEKVEAPRFFRNAEKRLKRIQRKFSKTKKGSKNREKQRVRVAREYEKITNCRRDFNHKQSSKLCNENQVMFVEDLHVKGMAKNSRLAKSIQDAGWYDFIRMLEYKGTLIKIGRFERSTGVCTCGNVLPYKLSLSVRQWNCPICGLVHDRDVAAAQRIEQIGLRDLKDLVGKDIPDPAVMRKPPEKRTSGRVHKKSAKYLSVKEEFVSGNLGSSEISGNQNNQVSGCPAL